MREVCSEHAGDAFLRGERDRGGQHGIVAELCGVGAGAERGERRRGIARGPCPALVGAEKDLPESAAFGQVVFFGMLVEPRLHLGLRGLVGSCAVLDEEFEFLAHAAADDGVVGVDAHGDGFAIADFLADEIIDEGFDLLARGQPAGEQDEALRDLVHATFGDGDGFARGTFIRAVDEPVEHEQRRAEQENAPASIQGHNGSVSVVKRSSPHRRSP